MCSSSHETMAWLTGMNLPIRASAQSLSVRNRPRMSWTPTSIPPLLCESYLAGCSWEIDSTPSHFTRARSRACTTSVRIAGSLSAFTIMRVWPSHSMSLTTS